MLLLVDEVWVCVFVSGVVDSRKVVLMVSRVERCEVLFIDVFF